MRVLVIEDFTALREAISQGLREAGFCTDETAQGDEGLWYAESFAYDVIILDLMLPGLDGLSILSRLREQNCAAHILILTAKDTSEDRVRGLNLGADDYLIKPFVFEELLARVRTLIRRKYNVKSPVLQIADLEINTVARMVKRDGKDVQLSAKEYALLEFLAHRPEQIVTRSEIWEHIYDFKASVESNVVDVFIKLIRKKLEGPGLVPLIHTFRGQGYLLGAKAGDRQ